MLVLRISYTFSFCASTWDPELNMILVHAQEFHLHKEILVDSELVIVGCFPQG